MLPELWTYSRAFSTGGHCKCALLQYCNATTSTIVVSVSAVALRAACVEFEHAAAPSGGERRREVVRARQQRETAVSGGWETGLDAAERRVLGGTQDGRGLHEDVGERWWSIVSVSATHTTWRADGLYSIFLPPCDLDDVTLYHWTHCDHYERDAEICCRSLCHFLARPVCGKCEELMHSHCQPLLPHSLTFDLVPCCRPDECDCLWAVRTTWCKETCSKWVLHLSIPHHL